jgi:peroxiredoxin
MPVSPCANRSPRSDGPQDEEGVPKVTMESELAAERQRSHDKWSPEERAVRDGAITEVAEAKVADRAMRVGETIPLIELPDATGRMVNARDLLDGGPLVISFYRGGWCPYCNLELRALQMRLSDIQEMGASLVAISPELPDRSLSVAEKNELAFPVLSDKGNGVARQFRLTHRIAPAVVGYQLGNGNDVAAFNGSDVAEVPLPATYVVDTQGVVRFAFVSADYTRRADPDAIVAALRDVVTAGRPG